MKSFRGRTCLLTVWIAVFAVCFTGSSAWAQAIDTPISTSNVIIGNAFIPQGTVIPVQLVGAPGLKTLFVGKALSFKTLEPVVVNETIVVEKGYIGYAVVTQVKKVVSQRSSQGGPEVTYANVELHPHSIRTLNWLEVPLTISVWANLREVQKNLDDSAQIRELIDAQFRKSDENNCGLQCADQPMFFVAVAADVDLQVNAAALSRTMPAKRSELGK